MKPTQVLPLFLLLAVCGTASAQISPTGGVDAGTPSSQQADELAHRGNALSRADRWVEAEPLFREAWRLKRSYDIAANLGIAEAALDKYRDAAEHLRFALQSFPANGKKDHLVLIQQTLTKMKAHVAQVTVRVDVSKADVFVDGKPLGTAPLADVVFLEPGPRALEARLSGYEPAIVRLDAQAGRETEVALELHPKDALPGTSWKPGVAWAISGGAVAAVGLGLGIGLTVASQNKVSDANAELAQLQGQGRGQACSSAGYATQCAALSGANQSADTLSAASVVSYVAAGVGVAALATYVFWPRKTTNKEALSSVTPFVGWGSGGIAIHGDF